MKTALAQMKVIPGRPQVNLENMLKMIANAKEQEADLVIFPEMCVSGYLVGDNWTNADFCNNLMSFNQTLKNASEGIALAYGNVFMETNLAESHQKKSWHPNKDGRFRKYNAIYVFQNGKPVERTLETSILPEGVQPKTLLPTYRIFDDQRYFFSAEDLAKDFNIPLEQLLQPFLIKVGKEKRAIGFELCEDLWCEDYRKNQSPINPTKMLIENGAEMVMNLSASPWTFGKNAARDKRISFLKEESGNNFVPFFYVNCVGVQNNGKNIVTFDGGSTVYNQNGLPVVLSNSAYEQELIIVDEKKLNCSPIQRKEKSKVEQKYEAIVEGLRSIKDMWGVYEYPKVIIGLSGGIDSCLVAALATQAYGKEKIIGVNMPTQYNGVKTKNAAKHLANKLQISYSVIPIDELVELNCKLLNEADLEGNGKQLSEFNKENVQAKIRGASLLSNLAAKYNGIFTNNGNKLETALGYATLYGDVGGAIAPIADLTKIEVVEMAKFLNARIFHDEVIPESVIPDRLWNFRKDQIEPSAELKNNQVDPMKFMYHCALLDAITDYNKKTSADIMQWYLEGSLHHHLDENLKEILNGDKVGLELMHRWNVDNPIEFINDLEWFVPLIQKNVFKRVQSPPIIITSKSAYGYDIRESMLPYESNLRQEELKKQILKLNKYQPQK